MQFVIVTGLSGAGKSYAMNVLEDIGFYCIDNMPPKLILKFIKICIESNYENIAIAVDIRSGEGFSDAMLSTFELLKNEFIDYKILYLEASNEILVKRYKETRRKHPLSSEFDGSLSQSISFEREKLNSLREIANYYIDTSYLSTSQLKENILNIFLEKSSNSMFVKVMSFGFKYGTASEADLVFDVRCLPNPYYVLELRSHTGCESCVQGFVMSHTSATVLLEKLKDLADFLIPLYIKEGKSQLVVAFGCTGGKHRSVTFAELYGDYLTSKGLKVLKTHRDITKDKA